MTCPFNLRLPRVCARHIFDLAKQGEKGKHWEQTKIQYVQGQISEKLQCVLQTNMEARRDDLVSVSYIEKLSGEGAQMVKCVQSEA